MKPIIAEYNKFSEESFQFSVPFQILILNSISSLYKMMRYETLLV